jgi:hypothetical protein
LGIGLDLGPPQFLSFAHSLYGGGTDLPTLALCRGLIGNSFRTPSQDRPQFSNFGVDVVLLYFETSDGGL